VAPSCVDNDDDRVVVVLMPAAAAAAAADCWAAGLKAEVTPKQAADPTEAARTADRVPFEVNMIDDD